MTKIINKLGNFYYQWIKGDFVSYWNWTHRNDEIKAIRFGKGMKLFNERTKKLLQKMGNKKAKNWVRNLWKKNY